MRQYRLVFMEQRMGAMQLSAVEGPEGVAIFTATDEAEALAHITAHHLERLKRCARAELSSLRIVADPTAAAGSRLVDDSHANPHFQDTFVKYNASSRSVDVDFESTRTALLADLPLLRAASPRKI